MMRLRLHLFVLILAFGVLFIEKAEAVDLAVPEAINDAAQESIMKEAANNDKFIKELGNTENSIKKALIYLHSDDRDAPAALDEIQSSLVSVPESLFVTNQIVKDVQFNYMRYLNRVPMRDIYDLDGDGDRTELADYLVDSSKDANVDVQFAANYLRLFCDPESRNAYWKDAGMTFENYEMPDGSIVPELEVFCGKTSTSGLTSRESVLGGDMDSGIEADQIISLPLRPQDLLFKPTTFPTMPSDGNAPSDNSEVSNTNRLANMYYTAFTQTMQLLGGPPPKLISGSGNVAGDATSLLAQQGAISRKMMAFYPFAILFAERTGTMGELAATDIAATLKRHMGDATQNELLLARLDNVERRKAISIAEYLDIVAYQLLLSPGYYKRISNELTPPQLQREVVWLTALQTALNYQRNRWMEIDTALEAVR